MSPSKMRMISKAIEYVIFQDPPLHLELKYAHAQIFPYQYEFQMLLHKVVQLIPDHLYFSFLQHFCPLLEKIFLLHHLEDSILQSSQAHALSLLRGLWNVLHSEDIQKLYLDQSSDDSLYHQFGLNLLLLVVQFLLLNLVLQLLC